MIDKNSILLRIKQSVASTAPGATLILYGSYARGDNREDSDIDLLILVDKEKLTYEEQIQIKYPLYHIEREIGINISPLLILQKEWAKRKNLSLFYDNVTKDGIVL